ncbi:MAG: hypothetical protein LBC07_01755 [Elusimicrobiota bacterium]|jgi:3-deoxy-D-manno-octulosonic-acid transferase|nr:hypothetical protein [Elusimicrobiota bacterium]
MRAVFLALYNFLFAFIGLIIFLPAFIFSKRMRAEIPYHFKERFAGFKRFKKTKQKTIWFHCSSLGEARAVEPLIHKLKDTFDIVLTTNTKTGRQYASKIEGIAFVSLLPFDIYPLMLKAVDKISPDLLILVETELWVSLLCASRAKKVPIAIVNARMSEKTYKTYKLFGFFWKRFIGLIDIIMARSADDLQRFSAFGAGKICACISGNIKYDRDFSCAADRKDFGIGVEDIVFCAGSTREGEEKVIAKVYKRVKQKYEDIKFFLVPRHINRVEQIKEILNRAGISFCLFSQKKFSANFILVDVFGILQNLYSIADICFVGGSIANKGGQNPIEPAAYAKPVLFGRYMQNFKTESQILLDYGGALKASTAVGLSRQILKLLADRNALKEMGQKAAQAVQSQKGAITLSVEKIKQILL